MNPGRLIAGLGELLGAAACVLEPAPAEAVVLRALPADAEQTAAVVKWARAESAPFTIGNGPFPAFLSPAAAAGSPGFRLDLRRLNRVRFYEPNDLTAGFETGLTATAVAAHLAANGQGLPLDAPRPNTTQLGAILAAHRSGPLRHFYGTVRDCLIGIEFVTPQGALARGGGKVVKNVAGYDLMRLLIGSGGALGVITAAHFKVFPRPSATETQSLALKNWESAEAARSRLLHSPLRPLALELTASAGDAAPTTLNLLLRYSGAESVRARYRREMESMAVALAAELRPIADDAAFWTEYSAAPVAYLLSAPSGAAVPALAELFRLAAASGRGVRARGRLGIGAFACDISPPPGDAELGTWARSLAAGHAEAWLRSADAPPPWAEEPAEVRREALPGQPSEAETRPDFRLMRALARAMNA